jgi:hypothetical protein
VDCTLAVDAESGLRTVTGTLADDDDEVVRERRPAKKAPAAATMPPTAIPMAAPALTPPLDGVLVTVSLVVPPDGSVSLSRDGSEDISPVEFEVVLDGLSASRSGPELSVSSFPSLVGSEA